MHRSSCAGYKSSDGRQRENPLKVRFIGMQKAYYSVNPQLPWEVLTRSAAPIKMFTNIRNFHEGVRARASTDDGEHSEWFGVTQELQQGCAISPLPFNVFFAAALHVVVVRFSKDEAIFRDLASTQRC